MLWSSPTCSASAHEAMAYQVRKPLPAIFRSGEHFMGVISAESRARLRVFSPNEQVDEHAFGVSIFVPCDGTYVCECCSCVRTRSERVLRGVQRPKNPWPKRRRLEAA